MDLMNLIGFSGQSNIAGFRSDPGLLDASAVDALIPFNNNSNYFDNQAGWGGAPGMTTAGSAALPQDALITLQPKLLTDGGGNGWTEGVTVPAGKSSWGFGPEITCAREMYADNYRVAVMKREGSGQPLGDIGGTGSTYDYYHNPQAPAEEAHLRDADGNTPGRIGLNHYDAMARIDGMRSSLQALGYRSRVAGWVWWHGHADGTNLSASQNYGFELARLIRFTRARTGFNMPWVIALHYSSTPNAAVIRQQQAEVARSVPGVRLYDPAADNLPIYTDNIHYWKDAHVTSGMRIAAILKEMGVGA